MLGCVDDERDESHRLEMRLRAAVEGHPHQYHTTNNTSTNTKLYAAIPILPPPPNSMFHIPSNGNGTTALSTTLTTAVTTAVTAAMTAEELSQRCREENDHFQRLLRMANM